MRILSHPFEVLFVGSDKIIINKGFVYDMSTLERFDVPELSVEAWMSSPEPFSVSDGDKIYIKITKEKPSYTDDPDLLIEGITSYYEDPPGNEVKEVTNYYYDTGDIYGAKLEISSSEQLSDDSTIYVKIGEILELELERIDQYVMSDIFVLNEHLWSTREIIEIDDSDSDSDDSDSDSDSDNDSDSDGGGGDTDDSDSDSDSNYGTGSFPTLGLDMSSSTNSQYLTLF